MYVYICIFCIYNGLLISLKKDENLTTCYIIAVVQSLSCVQLFETPWTATCRASLSSTISQYLLRLMSIELMMPSVTPFSYPQSFPASGSFPTGHLLASGGQSIGASASTSVLPKNVQGWFPLRLTALMYWIVHTTSCMSLKDMTLREISQFQKNKYCMSPLTWGP